jgi:hypothetical protein
MFMDNPNIVLQKYFGSLGIAVIPARYGGRVK